MQYNFDVKGLLEGANSKFEKQFYFEVRISFMAKNGEYLDSVFRVGQTDKFYQDHTYVKLDSLWLAAGQPTEELEFQTESKNPNFSPWSIEREVMYVTKVYNSQELWGVYYPKPRAYFDVYRRVVVTQCGKSNPFANVYYYVVNSEHQLTEFRLYVSEPLGINNAEKLMNSLKNSISFLRGKLKQENEDRFEHSYFFNFRPMCEMEEATRDERKTLFKEREELMKKPKTKYVQNRIVEIEARLKILDLHRYRNV
jgi:hypothetical protein